MFIGEHNITIQNLEIMSNTGLVKKLYAFGGPWNEKYVADIQNLKVNLSVIDQLR